MSEKQNIIKKLEEFNREAEDLYNLSFKDKLKDSGVTISWSADDKLLKTELKGPNDETLKAYCNDLRKFIQGNDSLAIQKLRSLYDSEFINQEYKTGLDNQLRELTEFLESRTNHIINGKNFTNNEIFEIFLYGKLSHRTEGTKEKHDELLKSFTYPILKNTFITILESYLCLISNLVYMNKEVIKKLNDTKK